MTPKRAQRRASSRTAAAAQRAGLPRVQALPPRRDARLAGVGRARRPRRPGDAPDRRRRRRSRRRRRPRARGSATASATSTACSSTRSARGPLALARAQRAQTARILIETTATAVRRRRVRRRVRQRSGSSTTRSARCSRPRRPSCAPRAGAARSPAAGGGARAAPAVPRAATTAPTCSPSSRARAVARRRGGRRRRLPPHAARCPHGPGVVALDARAPATSRARFALDDLRDLDRGRAPRAPRCSTSTPTRAPPTTLLGARPGARRRSSRRGPAGGCPGTSTPPRPRCAPCSASRCRSPARARSPARLTPALGAPLARARRRAHAPVPRRRRRSPRVDPSRSRCPRTRRRTLRGSRAALAAGELVARRRGRPRARRAALLGVPGIGAWTAAYVAMRALGDPDAFPASDLGVLRGAEKLGLPHEPAGLERHAERWRPWRRYAAHHLWSTP